MVYQRDYEPDAVKPMRKYIAKHIAPSAAQVMADFNRIYGSMAPLDQSTLYSMLFESYTVFSKNYVKMYMEDFGGSSLENMDAMFTENRAYFTTLSTAYEGAYTTSIGDGSFCYFGPGYANSFTVVHELGHFYASRFEDEDESYSLDLAETHSQGNEWLFMDFLDGKLKAEVHDGLLEYKMLDTIIMIIICAMIDEFEEKVYTHPNAGNLSAQDYDKLMEKVAERYGGIDYVSENMTDIQSYWKIVCMESPVYYISYGVSSVAALNFYTLAQEDRDAARQAYIYITETPDPDRGFLGNIQDAGLSGPFDEEVYKDLKKLITE